MSKKISAECHSDDATVQVDFDASLWARSADVYDLASLIECGCKNDYPADEVAIFMAEHDDNVKKMFDYIETVNEAGGVMMGMKREHCGFECSVNESELLDWLSENRPDVFLARAFRTDKGDILEGYDFSEYISEEDKKKIEVPLLTIPKP